MNTHLQKWHREIYDQLFPPTIENTQGMIDQYVTATKVTKLSPIHEKARKLTEAVCSQRPETS